MDTQTQISSIEQAIATTNSNIAANTLMLEPLKTALSLLQNGYQSDLASIASQVESQVGDIKTQNESLTAQVSDLQTQIATLTATNSDQATQIANLTTQVASLTPTQTETPTDDEPAPLNADQQDPADQPIQ